MFAGCNQKRSFACLAILYLKGWAIDARPFFHVNFCFHCTVFGMPELFEVHTLWNYRPAQASVMIFIKSEKEMVYVHIQYKMLRLLQQNCW